VFTSYALRPSSRATTAFNYYYYYYRGQLCRDVAGASTRFAVLGKVAPAMWTSLGVSDRCSSGCIAVGAGLGRADVAFHGSGHYRIVAPWASGDGTALLVNSS
jgi:hypothetical protein